MGQGLWLSSRHVSAGAVPQFPSSSYLRIAMGALVHPELTHTRRKR